MAHWVMDIETLVNCFTVVFESHNSNERKIFVIHKLRNDALKLLEFLDSNIKNKEKHIGYNNLAFDAQVIEYIIQSKKSILGETSADEIARSIYKYAQEVIDKSNKGDFLDYPSWALSIDQIDLYKLNHWDNAAKRSSLKWIQYSMDWHNLLDMPIHHTQEITTKKQINEIVKYNINDVASTKRILELSKSAIKLRSKLSKDFKKNLINASEAKISKEIFANYLSKEMNISEKELKKMRTARFKIEVGKIILDYIKFTTPEFKELLKRFQELEVYASNLKGSFKEVVHYKGVETHFGLGGVHGARQPGVYESDDDYVIMSSDVTSFYPNLVIRNKWSPKHIPKHAFNKLYESFFDSRKKIPKSNPWNYVYKLLLNIVYGLSNDNNSFLYDPQLTMQITINGQLSLMMLYEKIMENIPGATALMQNTDGIEIKIPRKYKSRYLKICNNWEKLTNLNLEHETYDTLVLADVNNYIGIFTAKEVNQEEYEKNQKENPHYLFKIKDGKHYVSAVKLKGRFDFMDLALHKNKSGLVIRKGIHAFFVNNMLPQDYVKSNQNIFDYCLASRVKGDWKVFIAQVENGKYKIKPSQKTNRYYISNKGVKILKNKGGSWIKTESKHWMQTVFNKVEHKDFKEYDVNLNYYISAIEKEIVKIHNSAPNQFLLF